MHKFLHASKWITGLLILTMPVSLIYFLGSQMAVGQVQSRFEVYNTIPEHTSLEQINSTEAGTMLMLRGQLVAQNQLVALNQTEADQSANEPLLIYQERPLDGREVRFQEAFSLVLPTFTLQLEDGAVVAESSPDSERIISHELHRTTNSDREQTGFRAGDTITVMGKWQPTNNANGGPMLEEVTGISGTNKAILLTEVELALTQVQKARNGLGVLAVVSVLLLGLQFYRQRKNRSTEDRPAAVSTSFPSMGDELSYSTAAQFNVDSKLQKC